MTPDEELRKRNVRLGLTLAAVAVAFFLAIVVRRYWFVHG
ncbi:MAG TPA: cytochrome oxidase small assembly protein [Ottowia sp.]|nr:cytochrome oxidase small assembly protein [Ottowia sp.]HMN22300.1 cytochrome oxidase small assembly protein [Ottowia sp.]